MRIVFCGSPEFAVPSLERLIESQHQIVAVVTQPDRPAGRGLKITPPPVKQVALTKALPVFQPEKFNTNEFLSTLEAMEPDVIVVVAYGKIFKRRSLEIPKLGCINLHASLLPKYRGIAPVNWAIINGEKTTGVTTILMDEGVDTGDIILSKEVWIGEDETAGELLERLARIGADLLVETCDLVASGNFERRKQDDNLASYAPKLTRSDGLIKWARPAREVHNRIRGVTPWPGAFARFKGMDLKILRSKISDRSDEPGRILEIDEEKGILVSCSEGSVWLERVQAPGRRPISGAEFGRGYRIKCGDFLENGVCQEEKG